jgi:hypothetical protein
LKGKNSPSTVRHGKIFTDTIACWVKKGYVSGPFILPPFPDFWSNSMFAVEPPAKIKAVMDLSSLEGESFNDAIHEDALEYVHMATESFGYSVVDCGKNCVMWKWDMVDAYKNIPSALPDLRLQGFSWLGCYFVERQQVFGSSYSVSAFDRLGNTITVLESHLSRFPINRIHRTLDDLPIVDKENTQGHLFCAMYTAPCASLGVGLAPPCPRQ